MYEMKNGTLFFQDKNSNDVLALDNVDETALTSSVTEERDMNLKWNVYRYNCNKKKIEEFNIFNHGCFNEDVQTLLQPGFSKDYFEHRLKALLRYYFWSKSEYEILISP